MSEDYYLSVALFGLASCLWFLPPVVTGRWREWRTWEGVRTAALAKLTPFEKLSRALAGLAAAAGLFVALR